jgi:hypothetical protein
VFRKKKVVPELLLMKRSRSPSPSKSTNFGLASDPRMEIPNGFAGPAVNEGFVAEPILRKKRMVPDRVPM